MVGPEVAHSQRPLSFVGTEGDLDRPRIVGILEIDAAGMMERQVGEHLTKTRPTHVGIATHLVPATQAKGEAPAPGSGRLRRRKAV